MGTGGWGPADGDRRMVTGGWGPSDGTVRWGVMGTVGWVSDTDRRTVGPSDGDRQMGTVGWGVRCGPSDRRTVGWGPSDGDRRIGCRMRTFGPSDGHCRMGTVGWGPSEGVLDGDAAAPTERRVEASSGWLRRVQGG
eukprot:1194259-Prorocentrum_minimum.AAC.3